MLLLDSRTFRFKRIDGGDIPPYAILSHTWGKPEDEVSYQEMCDRAGEGMDRIFPLDFMLGDMKAGYSKIIRCGELAASQGLDYIWLDTCCIDKSSSAELAEGINSMYLWYKNASVCYAYLADVSATSSPHPVHPTVSDFEMSVWFGRGWTLQELIAPANVIFFSKDWQEIGRKETLKEHIREITGIPMEALEGDDMGNFSVSQRMSWASKRKTTRVEDVAYSLLGIFQVNMPLLYGEGERSFIRLQEEIMKVSDDQSLFAWTDSSLPPEAHTGLLACSPKHFENSGQFLSLGVWSRSDPFSMTNKGLRAELFLVPYFATQIYRASLDCTIRGCDCHTPAIYLKRLSSPLDTMSTKLKTTVSLAQFARIKADRVDELEATERASGEFVVVYIRQSHNFWQRTSRELRDLTHFQIKHVTGTPSHILPRAVYPAGHWNPQTEMFFPSTAVGKLGGIFFSHDDARYMVILGLSEQNEPWTQILHSLSEDPFQDWVDYQTTGEETSDTTVQFSHSDNLITLMTRLSSLHEVYGTPVFVVFCAFELREKTFLETQARIAKPAEKAKGFFSNLIADFV